MSKRQQKLKYQGPGTFMQADNINRVFTKNCKIAAKLRTIQICYDSPCAVWNKNEQKYPKIYVFLNNFLTVIPLVQSVKTQNKLLLGYNSFFPTLPSNTKSRSSEYSRTPKGVVESLKDNILRLN